jgi:type I restriction enzyme S subunit
LRDGKNIAFSDFGNTYIPYPSIDQQKVIATYLDEKTTEIDGIIAQKKEQLTTLEAYKKSTIYEYVTGKKEVPA